MTYRHKSLILSLEQEAPSFIVINRAGEHSLSLGQHVSISKSLKLSDGHLRTISNYLICQKIIGGLLAWDTFCFGMLYAFGTLDGYLEISELEH